MRMLELPSCRTALRREASSAAEPSANAWEPAAKAKAAKPAAQEFLNSNKFIYL
jgi:hypothetical protein